MTKWAAMVEYDGREFVGWQSQQGLRSVQGCLETALAQVASHPISLRCAGRTDAGVHALAQMVHFETQAVRSPRGWMLGANTHLPSDISLQWVGPVAEDFDARFRAISRRYRYVILNAPARRATWHGRCLYEPRPLDARAMQQAARILQGQHDFSAFRGRDCQAKTPTKTVHRVALQRAGCWLMLDIEAGGFLHNMVRNIVGTLIEVGRGARPVEWVEEVLASRDRRAAGPTVAPGGLYFVAAQYPDEFALPPAPELRIPI